MLSHFWVGINVEMEVCEYVCVCECVCMCARTPLHAFHFHEDSQLLGTVCS